MRKVPSRPMFRTDKKEIHGMVSSIVDSSHVVTIMSGFRAVKEDPGDDLIINAAYCGNADFIVSGDRHLLRMGEFRGIRIIRIAEMLEYI